MHSFELRGLKEILNNFLVLFTFTPMAVDAAAVLKGSYLLKDDSISSFK